MGNFPPFQANTIRMLAAAIFIWGWTAMQGQVGATLTVLREKAHVIELLAHGTLVVRRWVFPLPCSLYNMRKLGLPTHSSHGQKAIQFSVDISL